VREGGEQQRLQAVPADLHADAQQDADAAPGTPVLPLDPTL
jgi:hypothetical protein